MPSPITPSITPSYALQINTSADDTAPRRGTPSKPGAHHAGSAIADALSNIKLRLWPDAMQSAMADIAAAIGWEGTSGKTQGARPDLQTYMDQRNRICYGAVANRRLEPVNHKVSHAFVDCQGALLEVVECREALDRLLAEGEPQPALDEATLRLEAAANRAADNIATLRDTLKDRIAVDRRFERARAVLLAVALAAMIVGIAFPPAFLACFCVTMAANMGWTGTVFGEMALGDFSFRTTLRDMHKWVRNQPAELVEAKQRLKAKALAPAADSQPAAP